MRKARLHRASAAEAANLDSVNKPRGGVEAAMRHVLVSKD